MQKIILASHGNLAEGMCNALELITGKNDNVYSFCMSSGVHPDYIKAQIQVLIDEDTEQKNEFLIITDLLGGSINNALMGLSSRENVQIVTGMNLSLVLQLTQGNESFKDIISAGIEDARKGITAINVFQEKASGKGGGEELW